VIQNAVYFSSRSTRTIYKVIGIKIRTQNTLPDCKANTLLHQELNGLFLISNFICSSERGAVAADAKK
jgi:hypothetical protein